MKSLVQLAVFLQLLAVTLVQPYLNGEFNFNMDEMGEILYQHNLIRAMTEPSAANMMAIVSYDYIVTSMK